MENTIVEFAQTQIVSANVAHYVDRYRRFAAQTVENILLLGQTVLEASKSLDGGEIKAFCAEVGIEQTGSTFRKLVQIGQKAERLESVADRLPSSWTTVYEIAKLDEEKFAALKDSNVLSATATMKQINKIVREDKKERDAVTFSLKLTAKNAVRAKLMFNSLKEIADQYEATVSIGNEALFKIFMEEEKLAA